MAADALALPIASGRRQAVFAVLGQTAIAVTTSFVAKGVLREVPAMAVTMLRLFGTAIVVLGLLWMRRDKLAAIERRDVLAMAGLGILGVTLNQALFLAGLAESSPARSSLLYALTPLVVLGMGLLRGLESYEPRKLAGIVLGFVGVAFVLSDRHDLRGITLRGDVILLTAVFAWASFSALGKPVLMRHDTLTVICIAMLVGTLAFLPIGVPALLAIDLVRISGAAWAGIVFMATASSLVAYVLWYFAIRRLPASQVALFMNLQPVAVALISWLVLAEPITWRFVTGALLVLAGVRLAALLRP